MPWGTQPNPSQCHRCVYHSLCHALLCTSKELTCPLPMALVQGERNGTRGEEVFTTNVAAAGVAVESEAEKVMVKRPRRIIFPEEGI